jgi:acetoacetyl-CoA synthetase
MTLSGILARHDSEKPLDFNRLPFSHPLYIMFSSGTTGMPKCIVHSAGGTLLQHLKEHLLHCDCGRRPRCVVLLHHLRLDDVELAGLGLACGATLCCTTARPSHPTARFCSSWPNELGITYFGTSAKYIDALDKAGLRPGYA